MPRKNGSAGAYCQPGRKGGSTRKSGKRNGR